MSQVIMKICHALDPETINLIWSRRLPVPNLLRHNVTSSAEIGGHCAQLSSTSHHRFDASARRQAHYDTLQFLGYHPNTAQSQTWIVGEVT